MYVHQNFVPWIKGWQSIESDRDPCPALATLSPDSCYIIISTKYYDRTKVRGMDKCAVPDIDILCSDLSHNKVHHLTMHFDVLKLFSYINK